MLTNRRCARPIAVACAMAALAIAPTAASARPAPHDPPVSPKQTAAEQIVREVRIAGDTTLPVIVSIGALLIAVGGAGIAGRDHRRIGQIARPQA